MNQKRWKSILVAFLLLLAIVQFANQLAVMNRLKRQMNEQQEILKEVNKEKEMLEKQVKDLTSPAFIEKQARERLKMIKPGEIPVNDTGNPSTETNSTTTAPKGNN